MTDQVNTIVETYLRPLVEADGGTIEVVEVNKAEVIVRLGGKCAGCPGRAYTLQKVLEPALRKALKQPLSVVAAI